MQLPYRWLTTCKTRALHFTSWYFCRATLCKRGLCRHVVSVCVSVTFVNSVKTNKYIFNFFSLSVSKPIFRREPPNGGVKCRWGRQKSRFWAYIWLHCMLSTLRLARCYQHGAAGPWKIVTLIAGSKRQSLLMAGDDDEMFMTRSLKVTPKTTEQHLIARSDKSVAYVTNNKRLCSTFCTIEANYWRHEASRGLFATAELHVLRISTEFDKNCEVHADNTY